MRWLHWPPAPDEDAEDDEYPARRVRLQSYFISRYPVTVRQWKMFMADVRQDRWRARLPGGKVIAGEDFNHRAEQGALDWPVANVSWYEALAYSDWLTVRLREHRDTPEPLATLLREGDRTSGGRPWVITLPAETEWEKAARGPHDARKCPWSLSAVAADLNRVNSSDFELGQRSTVGAFPSGRSPCGVSDSVGNVWEWTRSVWSLDHGTLVVRGGSFNDGSGNSRCSRRIELRPGFHLASFGFRVVVSPLDTPR